MPKKKLLTLSDRAAELLPQLAGYHDQGAYVSALIEAAAEHQPPPAATDDADLRRVVRRLEREVAKLKTGQQSKSVHLPPFRLLADVSPEYDTNR